MTIQRQRRRRHAISLTITVLSGAAVGLTGGAALLIVLGA